MPAKPSLITGRSLKCSDIPLPRINHFLSPHCHWFDWNAACIPIVAGCNGAAENDMKIYLLITLIGFLLTAVRFTSVPEPQSKSVQQ
jgi:hypothetical protein